LECQAAVFINFLAFIFFIFLLHVFPLLAACIISCNSCYADTVCIILITVLVILCTWLKLKQVWRNWLVKQHLKCSVVEYWQQPWWWHAAVCVIFVVSSGVVRGNDIISIIFAFTFEM